MIPFIVSRVLQCYHEYTCLKCITLNLLICELGTLTSTLNAWSDKVRWGDSLNISHLYLAYITNDKSIE